ncbi:MAG: RagB/SusD family nutrient uptake outer membrane protein [Bacteroidaceae bacterium]|nr:RagB/SusD family nutrient uptake outer membrane protein [Bacteroidaceae bacterium]
MKNKIYSAALALCAMASLASCDLDEYNPQGITGDEELASYEGIYGLEAKCYEPIYGQLYTVFDFMSMAECGTDTWWAQQNKTNTEQLFYYEGLAPFEKKGWDKAFMQMYSALDDCNAVIAKAENVEVEDMQKESVKTLVAEAHFLRAYYHLLLTTYYGPITLVTTVADEKPKNTAQRNTLSEIYSSITSDLKYAVANLPVNPLEGNRARATKKAAQGMLCRAYVQGAGQGLTENGVSYWERAKAEAEAMIQNPSEYGAYLYDDVADVWADANNRNNKEALFVAAGIDAQDDSNTYWYASPSNNKLFTYCYFGLQSFSDLNKVSNDKSNYLYGRVNNSLLAPSYYLVHCFNPSWDKRWENSFQTAFGSFSCEAWGMGYDKYSVLWTKALVEKYGLDEETMLEKIDYTAELDEEGVTAADFVMDADAYEKTGKQIWKAKTFTPAGKGYGYEIVTEAYPRKQVYKCQYVRPYANVGTDVIKNYPQGGNQYTAYVWPYGTGRVNEETGEYVKADLASLETPKKVYNVAYPMDSLDNRFYLYLYHPSDHARFMDKKGFHYALFNIDELFNNSKAYFTDAELADDKTKQNSPVYKACPCLTKFNWSYDKVFMGGNLQVKNGDIMIMRMAEIYLIAAEACERLGEKAKAAEYLNVLRKRAARETADASEYTLTTSEITEDMIFDEYARELCGEFNRWALLQRHGALASRLAKYNQRAAKSYKEYMKWRPISLTFLNQIENKEEYGDNGYGATANSGLDGYEK